MKPAVPMPTRAPAPGIRFGCVCMALGIAAALASSLAVAAPEVRKALPVTPTVEISAADRAKTLAHAQELAKQGQAILDAQAAELTASRADLLTAQAANVDLRAQIKIEEKTIADLKATNFWDKWKFSIIGALIGIAVAIAAFLFTKAGVWVAGAAAKVGIKTVIP